LKSAIPIEFAPEPVKMFAVPSPPGAVKPASPASFSSTEASETFPVAMSLTHHPAGRSCGGIRHARALAPACRPVVLWRSPIATPSGRPPTPTVVVVAENTFVVAGAACAALAGPSASTAKPAARRAAVLRVA